MSNEDLDNEALWHDVDIRAFNDSLTNKATMQFYFSVSNEDFTGDGTYFVRFYNKGTKEYTYSTAEIIFKNIIEYHKQQSGVNDRLQQFIDFFKERFGFLTYPFELIVNVLQKISTVKFEEPKFSIPDIEEPFTHTKMVSATDFSFDSLLKDEVFKNIHNIYLILVDAVIVFALVNLAKNKIMGVFEK